MFHLKKIKAGLYLVYDWWDFIYYMVNQINIAIKKKTHGIYGIRNKTKH